MNDSFPSTLFFADIKISVYSVKSSFTPVIKLFIPAILPNNL